MKNKSNNYNSTTVSVSTTKIQVIAANTDRNGLILYNQGADDIKLFFGDINADSTLYLVLAATTAMHFPVAPQNEISGYTDSGTSVITVMEA